MLKLTQSNIEKVIFAISILLFSFSLYPYAVTSIIFISFVFIVVSLRYEVIKQEIKNTKKLYTFVVVVLWTLWLSLSSLYSENIDNALKLVLRYLNILLVFFVFIFAIGHTLYLKRKYLFLAFILSNFIFSIVIYCKAISVIETTCFPEIYYQTWIEKIKFMISKPNHIIFACFDQEYRHSFFIHRVYNSMNYLFSILLIVDLLFHKSIKWIPKALLIVIAAYFCLLIYYQFSVVNIFLLLFFTPIFLIIKLKERAMSFKLVFSSVFISLVVSALIVISLSKHNVAIDQITPAYQMAKKLLGSTKGVDNADIRYEINEASKQLFIESPIIGYGVGDSQDKLVQFYKDKSSNSKAFKKAYDNKLNSHNYYYFLVHSTGVLGLGLFMLSLGFMIILGIKKRNYLYVLFLLIIAINLLFENLLSRIHGVFFYSIFNALFLSNYLNQSKIADIK